MEKQKQSLNIHLSPTGELKFKGEINTPEELEVFQQVLDESHTRSTSYQKLQEITKVETAWQSFIFIGVFAFFLFTISFVAVRQINNLFNQPIEVKTNAR